MKTRNIFVWCALGVGLCLSGALVLPVLAYHFASLANLLSGVVLPEKIAGSVTVTSLLLGVFPLVLLGFLCVVQSRAVRVAQAGMVGEASARYYAEGMGRHLRVLERYAPVFSEQYGSLILKTRNPAMNLLSLRSRQQEITIPEPVLDACHALQGYFFSLLEMRLSGGLTQEQFESLAHPEGLRLLFGLVEPVQALSGGDSEQLNYRRVMELSARVVCPEGYGQSPAAGSAAAPRKSPEVASNPQSRVS